MGKIEREMGKRGERDAARHLSKILDTPVIRTQQFKGSPVSADLTGLDELHVEVKRTERLSLYQALDQACDAGSNAPIVMHRRNRKRWVVIFYLDDLLNVVKAINRIRIRGPVSTNAKQ